MEADTSLKTGIIYPPQASLVTFVTLFKMNRPVDLVCMMQHASCISRSNAGPSSPSGTKLFATAVVPAQPPCPSCCRN